MSQSNGQQTITAGSWTNIGTGPLTINLQSLSLSVNVVVSDTQPADNAQGNILSQARPFMQVSNTQAVWVRGVPSWTNSSGTAIIDVLLGTPGASGGVVASDGVTLPPGLAQTFGRDSAGNVITISQAFNGNNYVKTLTRNAAGQVTNTSQWVKQ